MDIMTGVGGAAGVVTITLNFRRAKRGFLCSNLIVMVMDGMAGHSHCT